MKIGILTLPIHRNYGGILQAFALQSFLKKEGHEVWIIKREVQQLPCPIVPLVIAKRLFEKFVLKSQKKVFREKAELKQLQLLSQNTSRFVKKHMQPQTVSIFHSAQFSRLKPYRFDTVIVGSDQVWRKQYTPKLNDYFLQFLGSQTTPRRIAYAASFGTDKWEYTKEQTKLFSQLIQRFRAVSVREASARQLMSEQLNYKQAEHVLDPVFLLEADDYRKLLNDNADTPAKGELFVYVLDKSKEKESLVQNLSSLLKFRPFEIRLGEGDESLSQPDKIVPPVEDWLEGLIQAKFVVTDSFHACAFAILFNKPFLVFGNEGRGLSRFQSLLNDFNLTNRLITETNDSVVQKAHELIDWENVNLRLNQRRDFSIRFLRDALKE